MADIDKLGDASESLRKVMKRAGRAWKYLKSVKARTVIVITHDEFSNYLINEILAEGLVKRPLMFNQAHVIDCVGDTIVKTFLHANVYRKTL